jgi:hypothetical protein
MIDVSVRARARSRPGFACLAAMASALVAIAAVACGAQPANVLAPDDAGGSAGDDGGRTGSFASLDGGSTALGVDVSVLQCTGGCADIEAFARGGRPPLTYTWTPSAGLEGPGPHHVCPAQPADYQVTVKDSPVTSGELTSGAMQAHGAVHVDVAACASTPCDGGACASSACDGGACGAACDGGACGAGSCDSVAASFAPEGKNPVGPWSYGKSTALGATFTLFERYLPPGSGNPPDGGTDMYAWWESGIINDPSIGSNLGPTPSLFAGATCPLAPGQLGFVIDPFFNEYTIARWTAPSAGSYSISAKFEGLCDSSMATAGDVHIQHDGVDVRSGFVNSNGAGNATSFAFNLSVAAGDTVDFMMRGGMTTNPSFFATLDAVVCKAPGDGG